MSDEPERPTSLPTIYQTTEGPVRTESSVVTPNSQEAALYGDARRVTCASCRHFQLQAGQETMKREQFLHRLVFEEQWKVRHLGAPPSTFGLCGESGGTTLTSIHTKACDHYTPARGRIREDGDW